MAAVNIPRLAEMTDGDMRVRTLLSTAGESMFSKLDPAAHIHEILSANMALFYGGDVVSLKEREVEVFEGARGFFQSASAFLRGREIEGGHEVRKVDLTRCTPADLEVVLKDGEVVDTMLVSGLRRAEIQWDRYSKVIDGKKLSSHLELYDHLIKAYDGDKGKVVKALIVLSETAATDTYTEAYAHMMDVKGGLFLSPLLHPCVKFDSKSMSATHQEDFQLSRFNPEADVARHRITAFRIVHEIDLMAMTVSRRVVHHT